MQRLKLGENFTDEQIFKELDNFNAKIAIVKEQEKKLKNLDTLLEKLKELEKENAELKAKEASKTAENEKLNTELSSIVKIASNLNKTLFYNVKTRDKELFNSICSRIPNDTKSEIIDLVERKEREQNSKSQNKTQQKSQNQGISL